MPTPSALQIYSINIFLSYLISPNREAAEPREALSVYRYIGGNAVENIAKA